MVQYRLPILSGLLVGTSYIPFYPWALFFCLTPLFLFWWKVNTNKRQAFFAGWLTQFVLNLIGFHWIAYTASEFGHFHIGFSIFVLIGFAAIAHLYYPIAGLIGKVLADRFRLKGTAALATYALSFALLDRVFTKIFPFHLGYPWLWAGWTGSQFTDVIGFEGLNIVTIIVNGLLAWAVAEGLLTKAFASRKPWVIAGSTVVLLGLINLAGWGRGREWEDPDSEIRVLAVQGNIGNFDKYMAELRSDFGVPIVRKYLELSRVALQRFPDAQVLIWPETAFPNIFDREFHRDNLQSQVLSFLRQERIPLLTGAYSQVFGKRDTFNGFFFFDSLGIQPQLPYRKSILLVFGETFPFSEYIPYMDKFFPEQGSFGRGSGPMIMNLALNGREPGPSVAIGPQICYEGLYPWFSAELAKKGAQIFTNVTNDSWFWKPFEPNQHLYMTFARAIEFRRPLIRATNTGITTAILASGEILEKSPIGAEWAGILKVPFHSQPEHTFYEKYGAAWPWILLFSIGITLVIGKYIELRSGRGRSK